jgi:hypothetical protein
MSTELQYHFIASRDKNDVLLVGLADAQFDTSEYLWFQRYFDPKYDDGIYIERDNQGQGTYGGIEKLVLSRDKVVLYLSEETARILDTEQKVIITFSATDEQFEKFSSDLQRIFKDEQSLEIQ